MQVYEVADERNATPAQISLAWLLHKDVVDAPIIGPRSLDHLAENMDAITITLTDDEIARLEEPIFPQWPVKGKN